jgi:hypothetical protein
LPLDDRKALWTERRSVLGCVQLAAESDVPSRTVAEARNFRRARPTNPVAEVLASGTKRCASGTSPSPRPVSEIARPFRVVYARQAVDFDRGAHANRA